MKKYFLNYLVIAALAVAAALNSCQPEDGKDGAQGPEGPQGERGVQGDRGPAGPEGLEGVAGNAGVMMYIYGSRTIPALTGYLTYSFPVAREVLEKSLVYAYYCVTGSVVWDPVPSMQGLYQVNGSVTYGTPNSTFAVYVQKQGTATAYGTAVTWNGFKIIVVPIPEGNIVQLSVKPTIDYSNYAEVAAYYGLPE